MIKPGNNEAPTNHEKKLSIQSGLIRSVPPGYSAGSDPPAREEGPPLPPAPPLWERGEEERHDGDSPGGSRPHQRSDPQLCRWKFLPPGNIGSLAAVWKAEREETGRPRGSGYRAATARA
jgi:hypothetical protein